MFILIAIQRHVYCNQKSLLPYGAVSFVTSPPSGAAILHTQISLVILVLSRDGASGRRSDTVASLYWVIYREWHLWWQQHSPSRTQRNVCSRQQNPYCSSQYTVVSVSATATARVCLCVLKTARHPKIEESTAARSTAI